MKLLRPLAILAAAGFAVCSLHAEGDAPAKPVDKEKHGRGEGRPEHGPKLSEADRAKLKAAFEAADKDPSVVKAKADLEAAIVKARESKEPGARKPVMEARKALMEARKAAAVKAAPSVAELLKDRPERPFGGHGKGRGHEKGGDKCDKGGEKPAKNGAKPDVE